MTGATAGLVAGQFADRVMKVLDDKVIEYTITRKRRNRTETMTMGINGWHILGGVAVAGAVLWSGMALGYLKWKPYSYTVKDKDGNEIKKTIHLPAADSRGNDRLGAKGFTMPTPAELITGTWLSPLRLLMPP